MASPAGHHTQLARAGRPAQQEMLQGKMVLKQLRAWGLSLLRVMTKALRW